MNGLVVRDLRRLLDASVELAGVTTTAALRSVVPSLLFELVPVRHAGWVSMDQHTGAMSGIHVPESLAHVLALMPRDLGEIPILPELLAAPAPTSLRIADVMTPEQWQASRLCVEVYRPLGGEHQIGSLLCVDDGLIDTLAVARDDPPFDSRELAMVEEFARIVRATLARLRGAEAADARASLTPRQRQVLAELATGSTMRHAAWSLGITEKTLENHLQAIYRRLAVSNRTAALHRLGGSRG